jgi:dCMP deaminase
MERLSKDEYFSQLALLVARRSTCARRSVGCVLVSHRGHILGTGYNGVPRGHTHCTDVRCPGASLPSGTGLDVCEAIHAEQNALLQCKDVEQIDTAYVTAMPCMTCTKLLLNTSCRRIVYVDPYPHEAAKQLWTKNGRIIVSTSEALSKSATGEAHSYRLRDTRPESND